MHYYFTDMPILTKLPTEPAQPLPPRNSSNSSGKSQQYPQAIAAVSGDLQDIGRYKLICLLLIFASSMCYF